MTSTPDSVTIIIQRDPSFQSCKSAKTSDPPVATGKGRSEPELGNLNNHEQNSDLSPEPRTHQSARMGNGTSSGSELADYARKALLKSKFIMDRWVVAHQSGHHPPSPIKPKLTRRGKTVHDYLLSPPAGCETCHSKRKRFEEKLRRECLLGHGERGHNSAQNIPPPGSKTHENIPGPANRVEPIILSDPPQASTTVSTNSSESSHICQPGDGDGCSPVDLGDSMLDDLFDDVVNELEIYPFYEGEPPVFDVDSLYGMLEDTEKKYFEPE